MKKAVKYLAWTTCVGMSIANIYLTTFLSLNKNAWGSFYIFINLLITMPFIISAIISIRNIDDQDKVLLNNTFYTVFLLLFIPGLVLPFTYELGGLLICIAILTLGLWGKFKLKNLMAKMVFLNAIGCIVLILDVMIVYRTV